MERYGHEYADRVWYGGGGFDEGDSDVEFGYSAGGFGRGNRGGRSERRDSELRRGALGSRRGPGDHMEFGNWGVRSSIRPGSRRYDRGYRPEHSGWGMERLHHDIMYGAPGYARDYERALRPAELRGAGGPVIPRGTPPRGSLSRRYAAGYDRAFRPDSRGAAPWGGRGR